MALLVDFFFSFLFMPPSASQNEPAVKKCENIIINMGICVPGSNFYKNKKVVLMSFIIK